MTDTIRDARATYHFWIDDAILDQFGATLGPYGLAVYLALARRAKQGASYPSIPTLARDTGMSERAVQKHLRHLATLGLITIEARRTTHGGPTSNLYTLNDMSHLSARHATPTLPPGAPDAPGVVHDMHQGGAPDAPAGASGAPEGVPLEGVSLEGAHTQKRVRGKEKHTARTGKQRNTRAQRELQGFPADAQGKATLRVDVLSTAQAWMGESDVSPLTVEHEFERWYLDGLAHDRRYSNMAAAFGKWLLSEYQAHQGASGGQGACLPAAQTARAMAAFLDVKEHG